MCQNCIPKVVNHAQLGETPEHPCPPPFSNAPIGELPAPTRMSQVSYTIDAEFHRVQGPNPRTGIQFDGHLKSPVSAYSPFHMMYFSLQRNPNIAKKTEFTKGLLEGLHWRFKMQRQFLFVLQDLLADNLITPDSMMLRIDWDIAEEHMTVLAMRERLLAFPFARDLDKFGNDLRKMSPQEVLRRNFELPLLYLATLMARSGRDIDEQIDSITRGMNLGLPNQKSICPMDGGRKVLKYSDRTAVAKNKNACDPMVGFWLPHGVNIKMWAKDTLQRYTALMVAYETWWGKDSWGKDPEIIEMLTRMGNGVCEQWKTPLA